MASEKACIVFKESLRATQALGILKAIKECLETRKKVQRLPKGNWKLYKRSCGRYSPRDLKTIRGRWSKDCIRNFGGFSGSEGCIKAVGAIKKIRKLYNRSRGC